MPIRTEQGITNGISGTVRNKKILYGLNSKANSAYFSRGLSSLLQNRLPIDAFEEWMSLQLVVVQT